MPEGAELEARFRIWRRAIRPLGSPFGSALGFLASPGEMERRLADVMTSFRYARDIRELRPLALEGERAALRIELEQLGVEMRELEQILPPMYWLQLDDWRKLDAVARRLQAYEEAATSADGAELAWLQARIAVLHGERAALGRSLDALDLGRLAGRLRRRSGFLEEALPRDLDGLKLLRLWRGLNERLVGVYELIAARVEPQRKGARGARRPRFIEQALGLACRYANVRVFWMLGLRLAPDDLRSRVQKRVRREVKRVP